MNSSAISPQQQAHDPGIRLPDSIVSPLDFGQIQRELFMLDEFLGSSRGASKLPFVSTELNTIMKQTDINPLSADDRARLTRQLQFVRRTAPVVQMSFASEPGKQAMRPLVRWFREKSHPNTLITIGVEPNIAGGCVLRTSTKTFDFSLQKLLQHNRSVLTNNLMQ